MSFIPEAYLEAVAVFSGPGPGSPMMVVTGHEVDPVSDPDGEATIIAENIWDVAGGLLKLMSSQYTLIQVNVYAHESDGEIHIGQWNGSLAGEGSSGAVVPQAAVLIQKQTGLAGRYNRGRMYVPGLVQTSVASDGVIDTTPLGLWQSAANTFLGECSAHNVPLVILHAEAGRTPAPVASLSVQALIATQRRRIR